MKKVISSTILITLLTISLGNFVLAQKNIPQAPESFEEAESLGRKFIENMPQIIKEGFKDLMGWIKKIWASYVFPGLKWVWHKLVSFLDINVEERKPAIKEEFKKEREEIKQEIPRVGKSLWKRFKELIK